MSFGDIFKKRLVTLYPHLVIAILLSAIAYRAPTLSDILNSLLLLPDIGFAKRYTFTSLWFCGVYIYVFMFYILVIKTIPKAYLPCCVFLVVLILLYGMYNSNNAHAINILYDVTIGVFPFCLARGVVAMGIGVLVGNYFKSNIRILDEKKSFVLELACLILLIVFLFSKVTPKFDYVNYIVSSVLILVSCKTNNPINHLLSYCGRKCYRLCSLSLEIYIYHMFIVEMLVKFDKLQWFTNYVFAYVVIVVCFSALMRFFVERVRIFFNF